MTWLDATERTVTGLGYEVVDIERAPRGLLRVYIDRIPGQPYETGPGEFVTVEDCEKVTRQLQHVLEVEGGVYERLEVSSPGLDRPLKRPEHYTRFVGEQIEVTLKESFQGRKKYRGVLTAAADAPEATGERWRLLLEGKTEQALDFSLQEVREARLVAVVDFKGRRAAEPAVEPQQQAPTPPANGQVDGGRKE